jgi:hypothetical protein
MIATFNLASQDQQLVSGCVAGNADPPGHSPHRPCRCGRCKLEQAVAAFAEASHQPATDEMIASRASLAYLEDVQALVM